MNQKIRVRNYCSDDFEHVRAILQEYPSPTGKAWSADSVRDMISNALKEQPDGVFVLEIGGKVVGFAIVMYRDWFGVAYLDYIQVKKECMGKAVRS